MTKLGTPIGAGPKGAIVVVGIAIVGVPPAEYWEPPSEPSGAGWSPPPLALGAVTAPSAPPPLASPRTSLRETPPLPLPPPSISVPSSRPPFLPGAGEGAGAGAGIGVASSSSAGAGAEGASLVSSGASQSGSSSSASPSPSSSSPLAQAGACKEGTAVVVVGSTAELSDNGSAPAKVVPRAVTTRKLANASRSANLVLIPKRSCPRSNTPPWAVAGSYSLVRASATGLAAPNKALINIWSIAVTADFQLGRMRSLSCCQREAERHA